MYFLLFSFLFLNSCSPFGNQSIIESISQIGEDIVDLLKTTVDLNSGGSRQLISAPVSGSATDVHQVRVSVGSVYQQSSYVTDHGHTVEVIISGTKQ